MDIYCTSLFREYTRWCEKDIDFFAEMYSTVWVRWYYVGDSLENCARVFKIYI